MEKLIHCQTVMESEKLIRLKKKSGESSTKYALFKAIQHYIECYQTENF
jgi:hypothetical protein